MADAVERLRTVPQSRRSRGFATGVPVETGPGQSKAIMLGITGRRSRSDSIVIEDDILKELQGGRAFQTLDRMAVDPTIAGILELFRLLLQTAEWTIEPASEEPLDVEFAGWLSEIVQDLDPGWQSVVADAGESFLWGFQLFEVLFSERDDGDWIWSSFLPYDPHTILRWQSHPNTGQLLGVVQQAREQQAEVPAWKLLHVRHRPSAGRPEGRSLARNAFLPWTDRQEARRITKIGIRRELMGMTKVEVPISIMAPDADEDDKSTMAQMENLARELERDIREGVVFPSELLEDGNPSGYKLSSMKGAEGRRSVELMDYHKQLRADIAIAMLADFILLGHEERGSFALGSSKTNTAARAIGVFLHLVAEHMEKHATPVIQALNPRFMTARAPIWRPGDIEELPLEDLGSFISSVGEHITPDMNLEDALRRRANLPQSQGEEEL